MSEELGLIFSLWKDSNESLTLTYVLWLMKRRQRFIEKNIKGKNVVKARLSAKFFFLECIKILQCGSDAWPNFRMTGTMAEVSVWELKMVWILHKYHWWYMPMNYSMIKYAHTHINACKASSWVFQLIFRTTPVAHPSLWQSQGEAIFIRCVFILPLSTAFFFSCPGLTHLLLSYFPWMDSELNIYTPGVDFFLLLPSWVSNFTVESWRVTTLEMGGRGGPFFFGKVLSKPLTGFQHFSIAHSQPRRAFILIL